MSELSGQTMRFRNNVAPFVVFFSDPILRKLRLSLKPFRFSSSSSVEELNWFGDRGEAILKRFDAWTC